MTYKQLLNYIEQLELQVKNNQQGLYDTAGLLNEYLTMRKDMPKLQKHMKKRFGSAAEITTRWESFCNFFKDSYLQLKKKLDF